MSIIVLSGASKMEGLVWGTNGKSRAWIRKLGYRGSHWWPRTLCTEGEGKWAAIVFKSKEDAEEELRKFDTLLGSDHLLVEDRGQIFVTD